MQEKNSNFFFNFYKFYISTSLDQNVKKKLIVSNDENQNVSLIKTLWYFSEIWKDKVPCHSPTGEHRDICMGPETLP